MCIIIKKKKKLFTNIYNTFFLRHINFFGMLKIVQVYYLKEGDGDYYNTNNNNNKTEEAKPRGCLL